VEHCIAQAHSVQLKRYLLETLFLCLTVQLQPPDFKEFFVFYTYAHYTPEGRLFYIGKGQKGRAYSFSQRGSHWKNIVAKYGKPDVQILANWKTEAEALDHEVLLIGCFKDLGHNLVNKTSGGEGTSGYKFTAKQIENNRKAHLGQVPWNVGKSWSEEVKKKVSQAKLGSIPWNKGIPSGLKHSDEFKQKISNLHKGNKWRQGLPTSAKQKASASKLLTGNKYAIGNTTQRKWIWVGTHIETGAIIRLVGEKELKDGGFQHANIIKCINGQRKSHKGYAWTKESWSNQ
jgi:hypothetical protein